jgi:hypothetical protein
VEFLGRQRRPQEAFDLLEARWDELSLERALTTAIQVARVQDDPKEWTPRIEPWFVKAKRIDPGSVIIKLMEAELLTLAAKPEDAEQIYRELLTRSDIDAPKKAIISNNLAFHLAKPGSTAEAKKLIDAAIDELGPLPDLLDTRGMIRMAAGEIEQPLVVFRVGARFDDHRLPHAAGVRRLLPVARLGRRSLLTGTVSARFFSQWWKEMDVRVDRRWPVGITDRCRKTACALPHKGGSPGRHARYEHSTLHEWLSDSRSPRRSPGARRDARRRAPRGPEGH